MRAGAHYNIKVTGRPTKASGIAHRGNSNTRAGRRASRYFHIEPFDPRGTSLATAARTRCNDASRAAAIAARHCKLQMAFHASRLTGTTARRACGLPRTCRTACSFASSTPEHSRDRDAGANPADRFVEADRDWIFQVLPTLHGALILAG